MVKNAFLILVILLIGLNAPAEAKKELPVEKDSPPSETEIICFAAKEKWVCAPASDQQQAKDKAMRLIEEKSQTDDVVIKTIPVEEEWNDVVIEESTTANASDAIESSGVEVENTVAKESTVINQNPSPQQTQKSEQQPEHQSNVFSDWKANHNQQWTLQAVGTTNLSNIERFITDNQLGNQTMSIATTEVKGAPWHIVLVGLFDNREQALAFKMAAVDEGASWASSAWPRPINGITTLD
ncbi:SPOR domain-containing protein [Marinicella rhabdoformis]|uniref:SPOR domain-containing protein n=1 Tax=Marinicella rhabdoformis TaxID=2580566 RepID=UPI0012AEDF3D|nr:SPOR domain-containing protein [Marinicella rhabdoformis]